MAIVVEDLTPSLTAIASYIRARTQDADNILKGTFTDQTTPPKSEAELIAKRAARHVALRLGAVSASWDDELTETAVDVAAVYAALQIETGYYGEGSGDTEGVADQLGRMYREQIAALVQAARDNRPGAWRMHSIPIVSTSSPAAYRDTSVVGDHLDAEQLVNGPDPYDDD